MRGGGGVIFLTVDIKEKMITKKIIKMQVTFELCSHMILLKSMSSV